MKIGIIIGTTRNGRVGGKVGDWVHAHATGRDDAGVSYELLDVASFDLALLHEETVPAAANRQYEDPNTQRWSAAVDACDAFVVVTGEYNHSVPASLKNAIDVIYPEWAGKPVAFVSYGAIGGNRAVEHLRQIVVVLGMVDIRAEVNLPEHSDFGEDGFAPMQMRAKQLDTLFTSLVATTRATQGLRA